jgi:hypothetical protein
MPAEIVVANYSARILNTRYRKSGSALNSIVGKSAKRIIPAKIKCGSTSKTKLMLSKNLLQLQANHGVPTMRFLLVSKLPMRLFGDNGSLRFTMTSQHKCLVNGGYTGEVQKKLPQRVGATPVELIVPNGNATVSGTTKEGKVPVSRKVRLYRKDNGKLVDEVKSDAVGRYQFANLPAGFNFFVVSHDSNGIYNAAISDNITA